MTVFGPAPLDLAGFLALRLSEHAVHVWDVAVTFDPAARVAPDAVDLLMDSLPMIAGFAAKQAPAPAVVAVTTTSQERVFTLGAGASAWSPARGRRPPPSPCPRRRSCGWSTGGWTIRTRSSSPR